MRTYYLIHKPAAVLRTLVCVLLCLSLCGCSMTLFDVEKLMRPPQATGNKEALHTLLLEDAGEPLEFVYPRSGEYRSAVISSAFAGGSVTGSIAFCEECDGRYNAVFCTVRRPVVVDRL